MTGCLSDLDVSVGFDFRKSLSWGGGLTVRGFHNLLCNVIFPLSMEKSTQPEITSELGRSLRHFRKQARLSLAQLAHLTDSSVSNLSKMETGATKTVSLELLSRIAKAVEHPLYQIVARAERIDLVGDSLLSDAERGLITSFRALPEASQEVILALATSLSGTNERTDTSGF